MWEQRFTFGSGELHAVSRRVGSNSFRLLESHWFSNSNSHAEITLWRLKKAIPPDIFCKIHFDFTQTGLSSLTRSWKKTPLWISGNLNIDAVCISRGLWHDRCSYLMSSNYNGTLTNLIKAALKCCPTVTWIKTHTSVSARAQAACVSRVCVDSLGQVVCQHRGLNSELAVIPLSITGPPASYTHTHTHTHHWPTNQPTQSFNISPNITCCLSPHRQTASWHLANLGRFRGGWCKRHSFHVMTGKVIYDYILKNTEHHSWLICETGTMWTW